MKLSDVLKEGDVIQGRFPGRKPSRPGRDSGATNTHDNVDKLSAMIMGEMEAGRISHRDGNGMLRALDYAQELIVNGQQEEAIQVIADVTNRARASRG